MQQPPRPSRASARAIVAVVVVSTSVLVGFGLFGPATPSAIGGTLSDGWRLVVDVVGFPCSGG